jgi:hypothetical protein
MSHCKLQNRAENAAEVRITGITILQAIDDIEIGAGPRRDLAVPGIDKNINMAWIGTVMIGQRGEMVTEINLNAGLDVIRMMRAISVDHQLPRSMINLCYTKHTMVVLPVLKTLAHS